MSAIASVLAFILVVWFLFGWLVPLLLIEDVKPLHSFGTWFGGGVVIAVLALVAAGAA